MRNEGCAAINAAALVVAVGWRRRGRVDESGLEGLKREPLALPRSSNPLPCKRLLSLISYQRARAILAMSKDESLKVIRLSSRNTSMQARSDDKDNRAISGCNVKNSRDYSKVWILVGITFIAMNVIVDYDKILLMNKCNYNGWFDNSGNFYQKCIT